MNYAVGILVAIVVGVVLAVVLLSSRRSTLVPPETKCFEFGHFTRSQVAKHDSPDDAWIIVDGKVYDISSYIDDHPGGSAILNNLGADNTKAVLEGPQHPETVRDILAMHLIGDLVD
ncbi:hypothetical protein CTAYLR_006920 [Chrysophaeum taylorii]|uniref:Cytochrome b5 heme-binding domain-containing protein n=1 Tax=Chrysophaeum taylorii TaxID=2483200 RepID=A0AAD7U9D5_9STRA|nr:hypothetical protein CTAYLR_006920 [Chrysophaeum taylorii]